MDYKISVFNFNKVKYSWTFIVSCVGVLSFILAASSFQECGDGDTFIPSLLSLVKWTPFFWGTTRFGMLIPLIAIPIHNPIANFILQQYITCFMSMMAVYMLVYILFKKHFWLAPTIFIILFLLLYPHCPPNNFSGNICSYYFLSMNQPYGQSIFLVLMSTFLVLSLHAEDVSVVKYGKVLCSFIAMTLAYWILPNTFFSLCLLPLLLFIIRASSSGKESEGQSLNKVHFFANSLVQLLAVAVNSLFFSLPESNGKGLFNFGAWNQGVYKFMERFWEYCLPTVSLKIIFCILFVSSIIITLQSVCKERNKRPLCILSFLVASYLVNISILSLFEWTSRTHYAARYQWTILVLAWLILLGIPIDYLISKVKFILRVKMIYVVPATLIVALFLYGFPSVNSVSTIFERKWGAYARQFIDSGCLVFGGDHWTTWPVLFQAYQVAYDRHLENVHYYGLASCANNTVDQWIQSSGSCLIGLSDEASYIDYYKNVYNVKLYNCYDKDGYMYCTVVKAHEISYYDLLSLHDALEAYHNDHGHYPISQGFDGLSTRWGASRVDWIQDLVPNYIKILPRDQRMNDDPANQYLYKSDGKDYKLISHHPDDCDKVTGEHPEMKDPLRGCFAYGFWTEGARDW